MSASDGVNSNSQYLKRGGFIEIGSNVECRLPTEDRSQISPIWGCDSRIARSMLVLIRRSEKGV